MPVFAGHFGLKSHLATDYQIRTCEFWYKMMEIIRIQSQSNSTFITAQTRNHTFLRVESRILQHDSFRTMFRFACIVLLAATASAGTVDYQACDSSDTPIGTNIVLQVDGVPDGTTSVTLVKGNTYNLQIDFTATTASATLLNKLSAEIGAIELPWNGIDPDACENLTTEKCPLKAGIRYTYKNSLFVAEAYPATSLKIIWKLVDAATANEVCFKLPAKIVNA